MPKHLKFCGCRQCRRGMHRGMGWVVRKAVRRLRRLTKLALRRGDDPPGAVSVPYTD